MRPRFAVSRAPPKERGRRECRVHAAPAVSCANCAKAKRTRAYRFSGGNPASPAQWSYGLYRALPGDEFLLSPSSADQGLASQSRLGGRASADLTPATGVRTTRFCRTQISAVRLARSEPLTKNRPAIQVTRPTLPRPPHPAPNVRDDRDTPLLRARDNVKSKADLG